MKASARAYKAVVLEQQQNLSHLVDLLDLMLQNGSNGANVLISWLISTVSPPPEIFPTPAPPVK